MSDSDTGSGVAVEIDVPNALSSIEETTPLVNSITNNVTVNDVANITLYWGGLPVMSDDRREVAEMVASANACLLNMGTVDTEGEETMLTAGKAANDEGLPLVVDPVGVGATSVRTDVATTLVSDLDVTIIKGNHAEISALAGAGGEVRGVESVGEYAEIAESATALAHETGAVVVASGVTDIVATAADAYEVTAGDPMMGQVVGTGCMLGVTLATFCGGLGLDSALEAALAGTVAFGLVGERAAEDGSWNGPASYRTAFLDTVAAIADENGASMNASDRVEKL